MKHGKTILGLLILVLASCYLPQNPGQLDGTETGLQLSVMTDKSREQGVYVNEDGDRFDIVSKEGPDGEVVKCVEALDIIPVSSGDGAASKSFGGSGPVKALILGKRGDGYPGVWEVLNDDSIVPVSSNESGEKNSKAGDSCEVDWLIHGFFGWQYHIVFPFLGPDSEDGYIFVGYAENTRGIDFGGKWKIEEGTTVAVYWRLEKKKHHYHLSRARIIGEPKENYTKWKKDKDKEFPHRNRYRHSVFVHFLRYLFDSYKFFFFDSFETYLVDVLDAEYDTDKDKYLVTGHVEGAVPTVTPVTKTEKSGTVVDVDPKLPVGTAKIAPNGEITITIDDGGGNGNGDTYERIVIDSYPPKGTGDPETDLILYDQDGIELARDDDSGPGQIDTEQLGLSLSPGTYYIKVYNKDRTYLGPYVVRLLSLTLREELPPLVQPDMNMYDLIDPADPGLGSYEPDDYAPNNIPDDPADLSLGKDNPLNRYLGFLDPVDFVDDDWLMFVLPPL